MFYLIHRDFDSHQTSDPAQNSKMTEHGVHLMYLLDTLQNFVMPGEKCAIFGCSTSRRNVGMTFFKVPKESDDFKKKWASELINVITKDHVIDSKLQVKINDKEHKKMWICGRHFSTKQYWVYSNSKKLKEGELPTLHIPKKSIDSLTSPPRTIAAISKREEFQQLLEFSPPSTPSNAYKDFSDFRKRVSNLSLGETWKVQWIES